MEEAKTNTPQPYERPTLQEWGTVADLTAVGEGGGGGDIFAGSVSEACLTLSGEGSQSNACS